MPQKCQSIKIPPKKTSISQQKFHKKAKLTSQATMIIFQIFPKYFLIERRDYSNTFLDIIIVYFEILLKMLFQDIYVKHDDVYQTSTHKGMEVIFLTFIVCCYFWLVLLKIRKRFSRLFRIIEVLSLFLVR
jgi:hypothetical protein